MSRRDFDPVTITPDGRPAMRARLFDATQDAPWRGSVTGESLGGSVTVLTYGTNDTGAGPQLHVHPHDETFLVIMGNARFFVGDTVMDVSVGEVAFGPAGVPYRFENTGPGRLQTIDIHHSPTWIQTNL